MSQMSRIELVIFLLLILNSITTLFICSHLKKTGVGTAEEFGNALIKYSEGMRYNSNEKKRTGQGVL